MIPGLAEDLNLPEWIFSGIESVADNFDLDGNDILDEMETKRMFEAWLRRQLREVLLPTWDMPQKSLESAGYMIKKSLGRGAWGTVYLCTNMQNKELCVKEIKKREGLKVQDVLWEFSTMKRLDNRHVARTLEAFHDYDSCMADVRAYYLVNEVYYGGDFVVLGKNACEDMQSMSESWWRALFMQCLEGLNYLHENDVLHCDIKEKNLMVKDGRSYAEPCPVFIDFGICLSMAKNDGSSGTAGYRPPESYEEQRWYPRGDVFSLGIVFFQLMSGLIPSDRPLRQPVLHCYRDPKRAAMRQELPWDKFPDDMTILKDLVSWMTQRIRTQRPRPVQALNHHWFRAMEDAPLPVASLEGLLQANDSVGSPDRWAAALAAARAAVAQRRATSGAFWAGSPLAPFSAVEVPCAAPDGLSLCGAPAKRATTICWAPDVLDNEKRGAGQQESGRATQPPPLSPYWSSAAAAPTVFPLVPTASPEDRAARGAVPSLSWNLPPARAARVTSPPRMRSSGSEPHFLELTVQLTRGSTVEFGFEANPDYSDNSLVLSRIQPGGALAIWNSLHLDQKLRLGDKIVAVNGTQGDVHAMSEELRGVSAVVISVRAFFY